MAASPETQEMLDFCGKHNITSDVEVIPIQKVNEAYERLVKSDVKYRFSIDMASLKIGIMADAGTWRSNADLVGRSSFEDSTGEIDAKTKIG